MLLFCIRFQLLDSSSLPLYLFSHFPQLLFKFIKRTLKGLHLFNNTENGVNIQFYILMITAVLQMRLKQFCTVVSSRKSGKDDTARLEHVQNIEHIPTHNGHSPDLWIESLTRAFQKFWKIGCHWIRRLRNFIAKPFELNIIGQLAADSG